VCDSHHVQFNKIKDPFFNSIIITKKLSISDLTQEQKSILEKYGKEFQDWKITDKGNDTQNIHREHESFFKDKLSEYNLENLQENEFADIYKKLWASNIWQNKDWYIQNRLLAPNGIEKIKKELKKLLYSNESLVERYNEFKSNIKGFGISSISEILHMVFPEKYCLWNDKPKTVLPALNLNILPERYFKRQINTGEEYSECVQALGLIKNEVTKYGVKDFIDLDVMLWHIYDDILPEISKELEKEKELDQPIVTQEATIKIESHEAAQFHLLELGNMLGYLTYTTDPSKTYNGRKLGEVAALKQLPGFAGERDLVSARKIDVIWFGLDENPQVCFEVEHTTGITSGLSRLLQIKQIRTKFIIVSSEDQRSKFEREMEKYPFRTLQDSYRFISYDELSRLSESAVPFFQLKAKLMGEDF